jgi:hypothetical protein
LGISRINFFPNKCLKEGGRREEWGRGGGRREKGRERLGKGGGRKIGKKGEKLDKVYLGAQECHFLQPALCAGRRAYSFVKSGPNFKDEQFIWKKKKKKKVCSRCSTRVKGERSLKSKKCEMVERKKIFI